VRRRARRIRRQPVTCIMHYPSLLHGEPIATTFLRIVYMPLAKLSLVTLK
jgi:hypothetical protein